MSGGQPPAAGSVIRYTYLWADEHSAGREDGRRVGLDDAPAWIVTTEGNAFLRPGPDIRPIPARPPGTLVYGQVSASLLQQVAAHT
jgi:hypothetical protein